jgi:hypothetical protein
MIINRSYNFSLQNEKLFMIYPIDILSDSTLDYFEINGNKFTIDLFPDLIKSYKIIQAIVTVRFLNQEYGYIWASFTEEKAKSNDNLKNSWISNFTHVTQGISAFFKPNDEKLNSLNTQNSDTHLYLFTDNPINSEIEIDIVKIVNVIPYEPFLDIKGKI